MAENVTYSKIVELLDNSQYLAALKKAEDEEKLLTGLRVAGGTAAVKAFRETEAAAKQAAKETKRAAEGPSAWTLALQANTAAAQESAKQLGDLRGKINLGAESMGKFGAALGLVSPELAGVAQGVQKLTGLASAAASGTQLLGGAVAGVATAAAATALVIAPLIGLYSDLAEAQEQARASEAARSAALDRNITFTERVAAAQRKALDAVKSDEERDNIAVKEAWTAALEAELKPLRDEYALLEKIAVTSPKRIEAQKRMNELVYEQAELEDKASRGADADLAALEFTKARVEAEKHVTDKIKDQTKATKDLAAELAKEQKAQNDKRAGLLLEMEERKKAIQLERKSEADTLIALEIAGDAREAQFIKDSEMEDERVKKAAASAASRTQFELDYASAITGELADALATTSDILIKSNRKGAKAAYGASVALGVASTTIAALKAGAETVAAVAAIPGGAAFALPAGAAMFAATEAAYVAKVAATPAPKFTDTPGPVRMGAAEGTSASFAANDTIVAARTPDAMLRQVLDAVRERPGPVTEIASTRRQPLGMRVAREPVILDLTSSLGRVTRGTISR